MLLKVEEWTEMTEPLAHIRGKTRVIFHKESADNECVYNVVKKNNDTYRVEISVVLPDSRVLERYEGIKSHDEALALIKTIVHDFCVSFTVNREADGTFSIQYFKCADEFQD